MCRLCWRDGERNRCESRQRRIRWRRHDLRVMRRSQLCTYDKFFYIPFPRSVYLRIQQQVSSSTLKLVIRGFQTCMYSSTTPAILHQMSPFVPISLGKYGYKYVEEGEEEGDFTSRVGQRNMIKDIIKQEIVIGEGENILKLNCRYYFLSLGRTFSSWMLCLSFHVPASTQPSR